MPTALLIQAIRERKQVTARYEGHLREFCPHMVGLKGDEYRVLGYQFSGSSSTGPVRGKWKCFVVTKLSHVNLREGPWHTDPAFMHESSQVCMDLVTAQVPV